MALYLGIALEEKTAILDITLNLVITFFGAGLSTLFTNFGLIHKLLLVPVLKTFTLQTMLFVAKGGSRYIFCTVRP